MHPKLPFLGQVFINLIFQCAIALSIAKNPLVEEQVRRNSLLYFIASIGLILALAFAKASPGVRFFMLTTFSAVAGALMSQNKPTTEVVQDALNMFVAMLVVGGISAAAGLDLSSVYVFLSMGLIALIVMRLFTGKKMSQVGVYLFGLFVIADTNAILQKNYKGDVVQATLDYFLDFVNLISFMGDEDN